MYTIHLHVRGSDASGNSDGLPCAHWNGKRQRASCCISVTHCSGVSLSPNFTALRHACSSHHMQSPRGGGGCRSLRPPHARTLLLRMRCTAGGRLRAAAAPSAMTPTNSSRSAGVRSVPSTLGTVSSTGHDT
jgi:hypothetical protein